MVTRALHTKAVEDYHRISLQTLESASAVYQIRQSAQTGGLHRDSMAQAKKPQTLAEGTVRTGTKARADLRSLESASSLDRAGPHKAPESGMKALAGQHMTETVQLGHNLDSSVLHLVRPRPGVVNSSNAVRGRGKEMQVQRRKTTGLAGTEGHMTAEEPGALALKAAEQPANSSAIEGLPATADTAAKVEQDVDMTAGTHAHMAREAMAENKAAMNAGVAALMATPTAAVV